MLEHVGSYELAEWMAYERAFGPINNEWRDNATSAIYSQLQLMTKLLGQGFFGDENPIKEDEMPELPMPKQVYVAEDDELPDETDEDEDDFDFEDEEDEE